MLVFVCGMPRSGSTFSHNVVRRALAARNGIVVTVTSEDSAMVFSQSADHIINKAHNADDPTVNLVRCGAIKSICTIRKPEDAILSWMHTFGFTLDQSIEAFSDWFRMFERISYYSLILSLNEIERSPFISAYRIGRFVRPGFSMIEAFQAAHALNRRRVIAISEQVERNERPTSDIGFSQYDNETFFHRRHISDRTKFDRRPEVIAEIRGRLAPWINERGDLHGRYMKRSLARRAAGRIVRDVRRYTVQKSA